MLSLIRSIPWGDLKIILFLEELYNASLLQKKQFLTLIFIWEQIKKSIQTTKKNYKDLQSFSLLFFLTHFLLKKQEPFILNKTEIQGSISYTKFLQELKDGAYAPVIAEPEFQTEKTLIIYQQNSKEFTFQSKKYFFLYQNFQSYFKKYPSQIKWKSIFSYNPTSFLQNICTIKEEKQQKYPYKIIVPSPLEKSDLEKELIQKESTFILQTIPPIQTSKDFLKELTFLKKNKIPSSPHFFLFWYIDRISIVDLEYFLKSIHIESHIVAYYYPLEPNLSLVKFNLDQLLKDPPQKVNSPIELKTIKLPESTPLKIKQLLEEPLLEWITLFLIPEIKENQKKCTLTSLNLEEQHITEYSLKKLLHFNHPVFYTQFDQVIALIQKYCRTLLQQHFKNDFNNQWILGTPITLKQNHPDLNLLKQHRGIIVSYQETLFVLFETLTTPQLFPLHYFEENIYCSLIKKIHYLHYPFKESLLLQPKNISTYQDQRKNIINYTINSFLHIEYQIDLPQLKKFSP